MELDKIKDSVKRLPPTAVWQKVGLSASSSFWFSNKGRWYIRKFRLRKPHPSPIRKPLALTLKDDTTDNKRTEK